MKTINNENIENVQEECVESNITCSRGTCRFIYRIYVQEELVYACITRWKLDLKNMAMVKQTHPQLD